MHANGLKRRKQTLVKLGNRAPLLPGLSVADGFMRHPFDLANGVRTSGLVAGRNLKTGHRHDRHQTAYYGIAPSVFQSLVRRWRRSKPEAPIEEFTFIDMGAGMGRALMLAAEWPFRQVLGVELNPTLVQIARRNLSIWRRAGRERSPVRTSCSDAVEFNFPPGPSLVFLFNPFGASVMRRLLQHISQSFHGATGQLDLLYVNNEQEAELERHGSFRRIFLGQIQRSRSDAIADHAILANQPDGEYASSNYEDCSIWRLRG